MACSLETTCNSRFSNLIGAGLARTYAEMDLDFNVVPFYIA